MVVGPPPAPREGSGVRHTLKLPLTVSAASASPPSASPATWCKAPGPPARVPPALAATANIDPARRSPAGQFQQRGCGAVDSPVLFVHRPGALGTTQRLENR